MKKLMKVTFVVGVLLCVAGGLVLALVLFFGSGGGEIPDPKEQPPEERLNYLVSDEFQTLPIDKKREYFEKMRGEERGEPWRMMREARELPEEQRRKLRQNMRQVFHQFMKQRIDRYFELKIPEEKVAYLDKLIEEREKRHERMRERIGNLSDSEREAMRKRFEERRRGRHRPSLSHIKERIESTSPEDRARFAEFRMAMRARRRQTGKTRRGRR